MTKTELDTLAVMARQSSEIAINRSTETLVEQVEKREAEFELRFAEVAQTMMDAIAETRDSAEGSLVEQVKGAVEEATRIGEQVESIRSEMTDEMLSSLHEFTEQRDLKFKGLDEKSAAVTDTMRKVAEEFMLLNESATTALLELSEFRKQTESEVKGAVDAELESMRTDGALISEEVTAGLLETLEKAVAEESSRLNGAATAALLKLSEFQKQVSAELTESLEKRLGDMIQVLRLENVIVRDDVRTEVNELLANATNEVEKFLGGLEIPEPIPGCPGEPGEKGADGAPGTPGRDGTDGIVTRTAAWRQDRFYDKHATVTHLAGLWQARESTDAEPGDGEEWNCLVRGIVDTALDDAGEMVVRYSDQTKKTLGDVRGPPGREWQHKGTYDPKAWYTRADVVVVRGTSYVAVDDSPGDCPGDGWQMVAQAKAGPAGKPGKQGKAGEPGPPGPVGPPGEVLKWRGSFFMGEKYYANDIVSFSNAIWIALQETTELPKADGVNWDLMLRTAAGGGGSVGTGAGGDFKIAGVVDSAANLPSGAAEGDLWITTDDGHGHLSDGAEGWADTGPIQGPTGETGPAGATGPEGPAGADGVPSTDGSVLDIATLTQVEYDALSPPSDTTLYLICG